MNSVFDNRHYTFVVYLTTNLSQLWIAFVMSGDSGFETTCRSICWLAYIKVLCCYQPVQGESATWQSLKGDLADLATRFAAKQLYLDWNVTNSMYTLSSNRWRLLQSLTQAPIHTITVNQKNKPPPIQMTLVWCDSFFSVIGVANNYDFLFLTAAGRAVFVFKTCG